MANKLESGAEYLAQYRSHKIVRAGRISGDYDPHAFHLDVVGADGDVHKYPMMDDLCTRYNPKDGDYFVVYADGYCSISPKQAFEEGYTLEDPSDYNMLPKRYGPHFAPSPAKLVGLPVAGYVDQPPANIDVVNVNKRDEETILRRLDALAALPGIDGRWLAIGRTQIEQAFMSINRAVFKPERVKL